MLPRSGRECTGLEKGLGFRVVGRHCCFLSCSSIHGYPAVVSWGRASVYNEVKIGLSLTTTCPHLSAAGLFPSQTKMRTCSGSWKRLPKL